MRHFGRGVQPRELGLSEQETPPDELVRGWVFTLKSEGKVASGTDVHRRALILQADQLTRTGEGGGITSALTPSDPRTMKRLQRDRYKYKVVLVRKRGKGDRQKARDPQLIYSFLSDALELAPSVRFGSWKAKNFVEWLVKNLRVEGSDIYKLAAKTHPLLLEYDRTLRWWQNRVAELKKMSR